MRRGLLDFDMKSGGSAGGGTSGGWGLSSLTIDFSTLPDGSLPTLVGSKWAVSSGKGIATPDNTGDVIVNGGFATDTDWTKGAGWTIAGDGSPAAKAAGTASTLFQATLTTNVFYKAIADIVRTAGTFYLMFGTSNYQSAITASGTIIQTFWASSTRASVWGGDAAAAGSVDNVKYYPLSLMQCSALAKFNNNYGQVKAQFTIPNRIAAGVWMCVDDPANIKNGILACMGEGRSLRLQKLVNGVFTALVNSGAYTDGQVLEIRRAAGTDVFQLFANNAQVGTDQTVTGMTGLYHGLFSTDPTVTCSNFFFRELIAEPSTVNLLLIGDSKTIALGAVATQFIDMNYVFAEIPTRIATVGWKADELAAALPDALAAATGTPDKILINIGSNDVAAGRTEANYKVSLRTSIELVHAKYPAALVGLAKPVILGGSPPSTPLAGVTDLHAWIDTVRGEYAYCFAGPDELGMENGDSYVTYLVDLTHNTTAGKKWVADHWISAMGY